MDTAYDVFTTVKERLLKQNARCTAPSGNCCFSRDGLRCAIGVLLTPEEIRMVNRMEINFASPKLLFENLKEGSAAKKAIRENFDLISDLQGLHDGVDVDKWPLRFKEIEFTYFGKES